LAKRNIYFAEAERLYVIEQMTFSEIASRLKLNEKTLSSWKSMGDWETKRKKYIQSKLSFHEELYEFSRKLMESIKSDIDRQEKVDPGRLYALARILPLITKVKDYEDVITKSEEKEQNKGLTKDLVSLIEAEVLGIKTGGKDE
jgi:uncharacterized protein YjcR